MLPSVKSRALPRREGFGRHAIDVIDVIAAVGLAGALSPVLHALPRPLHVMPYFALMPLFFAPILRSTRWQRAGFIMLVGVVAGVLVSLPVIR